MRLNRLASLVMSSLLALAACGGGSGGSENIVTPASASSPTGCSAADCGTALISLTDADGDFMSYAVDVVSLSLTRANGSEVQTLPVTMRVDFAQLVELSELITAATIPNGSYVAGTIRLDYTNADIAVDLGGEAKPAVIVDANGDPVAQIDLEIRLDDRNHLVIAPGRPALLQLDFDLAASNDVNLGADPVKVTPRPFIVASVDRADSRELRVRGPLVSVNTIADSYMIDLRPFLHRDARLGELTVRVTDQTAYEIDGESFIGNAGLEALATLPTGTATAAFGTLEFPARMFTAERVHAASSVEGPRFDVARGNVVARSGDELTLRGVTLARRDGGVRFVRGDITLLVGPDTRVTKDGQRGVALEVGAISVGQRLHAFGHVSEGSSGALTLDARDGRVRLHLTHLLGLVQSAQPGQLTLDLHAIDRNRVSLFNFAGTGVSPGQDAHPAEYEIATHVLNLERMMPGSPARVFGFVTPFGAAPPDFEGRTVVDFEEVRAQLVIGYFPEGTPASFTSIDPTGIVVDTANAAIGERHHIVHGPRLIDVLTLATPLRLVGDGTRPGTYAIGKGRTVEVFTSFADFAATLAEALDGATRVLAVHAEGRFEAATADFTTDRVLVTLRPQ